MRSSFAALLVAHFVLAAATLAVLAPQWGAGLMLYDVGEVAFYVDKILAGARPGLDYAVNGYGPGRYLLVAALRRATDAPLLPLLGAVFLALRVLLGALVLECGRALLPERRLVWVALPIACLLLAPGPLHKSFYLAGSAALLLALVRYLQAPRRKRAVAYGLTLLAVAAFRLDLGLFGSLAFLFAAAGDRRRLAHLALAATPLLVAGALSALTLARHGDGVLAAVVEQILDDAGKNQRIAHPTFPTPMELLTAPSLDRALLWLPIVVYGALLLALLRAGRFGWAAAPAERRRLGALLLLGVLTANQVRMKPEFGHLLQAGPLLYLAAAVLAAAAFERASGALGRARVVALAASLPVLLLVDTLLHHRGSIYTGSFTIPSERTFVLDTPIGRVRLNRGEHAELAPLLRWLRDEAPPGPLWVPTNQPLLLALSERPDVTGYVGVVYYADDGERERALIERIEAARPPVAVFVDDSIEGPERRLENAAPRVHAYLLSRYEEVARFGRARAMVRVDAAALPERTP